MSFLSWACHPWRGGTPGCSADRAHPPCPAPCTRRCACPGSNFRGQSGYRLLGRLGAGSRIAGPFPRPSEAGSYCTRRRQQAGSLGSLPLTPTPSRRSSTSEMRPHGAQNEGPRLLQQLKGKVRLHVIYPCAGIPAPFARGAAAAGESPGGCSLRQLKHGGGRRGTWSSLSGGHLGDRCPKIFKMFISSPAGVAQWLRVDL